MEYDASVEPRRSGAAGTPRRRPSGEAPNTPEQYELLLAKLAEAERELEEGATGRNGYLETASSIVFGLLSSLDFKQGGELAPRLAGIYGYIANELLSVSRTGDAVQLVHLKDIITTLQESWKC